MPDDQRLIATLSSIRDRGAIGEVSLVDAVAHADRFVRRIPAGASNVVDLGSGGGLPGLVIAWRLPHVQVVLVERRQARADQLLRAALVLDVRVEVRTEDVSVLAGQAPHSFDVVSARSFARPAITARWGSALLRADGVLLVSEPPDTETDRWPESVLRRHALSNQGVEQGIRAFRRVEMFHVEQSEG